MAQKRDYIIHNAVVRTVDTADSVHSAVLMREGKIFMTGSDNEVIAGANPDAELFDAGGRAVVPGFIDPHQHPSVAAFSRDSADCSTPPLTTLDEVLAAIEKHCANVPGCRMVR